MLYIYGFTRLTDSECFNATGNAVSKDTEAEIALL